MGSLIPCRHCRWQSRHKAPDITLDSVGKAMEDDMDAEQLGVATALERTVELERRLRQAIHDTHAVTSDFDTAAETADAERDALLAVKCAPALESVLVRTYSADHTPGRCSEIR